MWDFYAVCLNAPYPRWRFEQAVSGLPPSCLRSNSGAVLRQAALAGVGVLMQAEVLVREGISAGRFIPVLRDFWPSARPMHLVYLRDR
nr:LysR substrate-binding domain-containing protein [uncultured Undibacterium sp.]